MIGKTNSSSMSNTAAALDFTVVNGLTEPVNPKEKMIWIATDEEIMSWVFSATEPAAQQGLVWFLIGQSSSVAFSITKNNPIMVYPIKAQQYKNNAWVEKTTKIYLNNSWVKWNAASYWFKAGEGQAENWISDSEGDTPVIITSDSIILTHDWIGNTGYSNTMLMSKATVNLNNINTLYFDISIDKEGYSGISESKFGVATGANGIYPTFVDSASKTITANNRTIYEIDVSTLNGNYYLAARGRGFGLARIVIYNIYGI